MKKLVTLICAVVLVYSTFLASALPANAAQTYAVVHDGQGDFFIAKKNKKGYFFHKEGGKPGEGELKPTGQTLRGGDEMALPGGGLRRGMIQRLVLIKNSWRKPALILETCRV